MAGALTGLIGSGGGGVIGGATVRLVLDSSQFNSGLAQAQGRLSSIGSSMSRVGSSLTRGVTVPLVAAGAVATKMALDFNKAFVSIQTLATQGGHSIGELKAEVLSLAQATGQDPSGLANALYQVLSAGKAAASQAFPILTASAKAAAIGMGSATDVAKVLTATMNAYGPSVISAGTAADVLTQAQKDSAASSDALATSIGPVIGIAAQAGVSFQEVAAAMATATNAGIDTARAATGLRFLIGSLTSPTTAAATALDHYGISVQDLQRMLSQQGLIGTLQSLAQTFDLSTVKGAAAFKALVGGQRGFVSAASLVGKTAGAATAELDRLNGAAGRLNKSFTIWGQTITGKNAIALGRLKVAAIQLGESLIPLFEKVVGAVTTLANAFNALPGPMKSVVVNGLLIAALAGPFLKLGGAILGLIGKFTALAAAEDAAAVSGAAATGLTGTAASVEIFNAGLAELASGAGAAAASIGVMTVAGASAIPVLGALGVEFVNNVTGAQTMRQAVVALRHGLASGNITQQQFIAGMRGIGPIAAKISAELDREAQASKNVRNQFGFMGNAVGQAANQVEQAAGSFVKAGHATGAVTRGVQQVGNAAVGAAGDMGKASGAANNLTGSINKIPTKHTTTITANANQAIAAAHAAAAALNTVPRSITSTITTVARHVTTAAGHLATGGITHGSVYMVGEGSYSTFAGRGAEAVIPLNDRTLGRLADQLNKRCASPSINLTINTQGAMDPDQLAASVSRHLSRTIREEALV